MKTTINNILRKFGLQIFRYPTGDIKRRLQIITNYKINKIIDVGANSGQYASNMRELKYEGEIISFEPLSSAYSALKENSKNDTKWHVYNNAIGDQDGNTIINVAANSASSSMLDMLEQHKLAAPNAHYVGQEETQIKKIDSIFHNIVNDDDKVMLKIDTQGFEKNVIDGATYALSKIILIQLEMSLVPLYNQEILLPGMISYLESKNFQLISIENGFTHPTTLHLLQADGIFINKNYLS